MGRGVYDDSSGQAACSWGGSRGPPGSPSHGGVLGEHSWGPVLSCRALCSPGGGVSEEGCCGGAEDRPGAGGLHQPQGGEADGDDGGVRRHALRRAAADREASQGDRRVPRGSVPAPASLQRLPRLSPCWERPLDCPSCGSRSCPALSLPSRISAGKGVCRTAPPFLQGGLGGRAGCQRSWAPRGAGDLRVGLLPILPGPLAARQPQLVFRVSVTVCGRVPPSGSGLVPSRALGGSLLLCRDPADTGPAEGAAR